MVVAAGVVGIVLIQRKRPGSVPMRSPQWIRRSDGTGWVRTATAVADESIANSRPQSGGVDWSKVTSAVTAFTALAALTFTAQSLSATRDQINVSEQGQITDRYTTAVDQISTSGADHLETRLGGIYALERLAADSPRDQPTVVEVLSAFVRSSASLPAGGRQTCPPAALDVQAALTVLGRRDPTHDANARVDLTNSCLVGVRLTGANLAGANLYGDNLSGATLDNANLTGAALDNANLTNASLFNTSLVRTVLNGGNLSEADLDSADLSDALLYGADLSGADLKDADLSGAALLCDYRQTPQTCVSLTNADLSSADLSSAYLDGADLSGADLTCDPDSGCTNLTNADLTGANLTHAKLDGAIGFGRH